MQPTRAIRTAKAGYLTLSIIICMLGIFMIVYPKVSLEMLCYLAGSLMTLYGIVKIIGYFSKDLYRLAFQYDLAFGIFVMVIGIVLLCHRTGMIKVLYFIIGVLAFMDGLFKIQMAIDSKRFGIGKWWLITLIAVLTSIFGLVLIIKPFEGAETLMVLMGVAFLLEGGLNISVAVLAIKIIKDQLSESKEYDIFV